MNNELLFLENRSVIQPAMGAKITKGTINKTETRVLTSSILPFPSCTAAISGIIAFIALSLKAPMVCENNNGQTTLKDLSDEFKPLSSFIEFI